MSQQTVGRPLAITHLTDVDGIDPRRRLRLGNLFGTAADRWITWRIGAHDRRERVAKFREQIIVEPGADAPRIHETAADHIGELKRAKTPAAAFRLGESDDHEVARLLRFD